jgi:hypothetical protein
MLNYKLPTITEYEVQEYVRATQWSSVPEENLEAFNKAVAEQVADSVNYYLEDGGEIDEELITEFFEEAVSELAYQFLEYDDLQIDDVIDSDENMTIKEEYANFRFIIE